MFTNAGMNQFEFVLGRHDKISSLLLIPSVVCVYPGKHGVWKRLESLLITTPCSKCWAAEALLAITLKKDAIDWSWELLTEVYKIQRKNYICLF